MEEESSPTASLHAIVQEQAQVLEKRLVQGLQGQTRYIESKVKEQFHLYDNERKELSLAHTKQLAQVMEQTKELYREIALLKTQAKPVEVRASEKPLPPTKLDIPIFRGQYPENVNDWLLTIDEIFEEQCIAENKKLRAATLKRQGPARRWYRRHGEPQADMSYQDLQEELGAMFLPRNYQLVLRQKLRALRQRDSLRHFEQKFMDICSQIESETEEGNESEDGDALDTTSSAGVCIVDTGSNKSMIWPQVANRCEQVVSPCEGKVILANGIEAHSVGAAKATSITIHDTTRPAAWM